MNARDYCPQTDESALIALRCAVWGADHRHNAVEFFRWLFDANPCGKGGGVVLEGGDGRILGFAGMVSRRFICPGEATHIALGIDYMIHPEARSGFAASRLARCWDHRYSTLEYRQGVCFPNSASLKVLTSEKVGWRVLSPMRLWARPLSSLSRLPGPLSKLPPWLAASAFRTLSWGCTALTVPAQLHPPGGGAEHISRFDARFDDLWSRVQSKLSFGSVRDAAHLNWRYAEHPLYRYRCYAWIRDGQVCAYAVGAERELFGIPAVLVVDALTDAQGALESLLFAIADDAQRNGERIVAAQALPGSDLERVYRRAGLVAVPDRFAPKRFNLALHRLGKPPLAAEPRDWYLTWGDMDVV